MLFVRTLSPGNLSIEQLKDGRFVVTNNQKPPNKLIIYCRSVRHGEDIIEKILWAAPGELIEL
ncbi:MAG: hypothetical protein K0R51_436 [Cytophagaceae bacterium]|jgi:hypothetical protein|nr:hypothetical protein [Cytophagaceae bacterium]